MKLVLLLLLPARGGLKASVWKRQREGEGGGLGQSEKERGRGLGRGGAEARGVGRTERWGSQSTVAYGVSLESLERPAYSKSTLQRRLRVLGGPTFLI